ncbi:MAG: cobalamin-dependent protein [Gammaproteobacteria bacterium]
MVENDAHYSIGRVERDTGIGRDTLRVWERRYGFPEPQRNPKGERMYSEAQLRRLQRIRRLLGQGLRPGKLLLLDDAALDKLEASLTPVASGQSDQTDQAVTAVINATLASNQSLVERLLRKHYLQLGMRDFIIKLLVPLLGQVGELWAAGKLHIYQEHFLSAHISRFLNIEIDHMQKAAKKPVVLLATLPGEAHTLGLMMVAAMLGAHGISAINLGSEVPMDQLERAVRQFNPDIVGITFSGAYQYKNIRRDLTDLRERVSEDVEIWAGGEGVRRLRKLPEGVAKFTTLEKLPL